MGLERLLVANRGEVAIRVLRAAAELRIPTLAVYAEDDAQSLHVRRADRVRALPGRGPAAYLDGSTLVAVAREEACDAVHPGYGFLSESASFARQCAAAGLLFVGPDPDTLELLGDKAQARALAAACGVPVLPGTPGPTSLAGARAFWAALPAGSALVVKAVAGGGGRGLRVVEAPEELEAAIERCRSEARTAFGSEAVYAEQLLRGARHVEVQILGDGRSVSHLFERECSLQRRHQKLVELAPCPDLPPRLRVRLIDASLAMAERVRYRGVGTFEFLVDCAAPGGDGAFFFIEANARLQVEHPVTELVTGVDLVQAQLELARGRTLGELRLDREHVPAPRGYALEARVLTETADADGRFRPSGGTLLAFEPPTGAGVRVETAGYAGYTTNPAFDPLLAKLVVHSPSGDVGDVFARAYRALSEFRIEGVATNVPFLQSLLRHPAVTSERLHTGFVEEHAAELAADAGRHARLYFEGAAGAAAPAGARIDTRDPLAVLAHGKSGARAAAPAESAPPDGTFVVRAPLQGSVVSLDVEPGDRVLAGQPVAVLESMKMEHVVEAERGGFVRALAAAPGDAVLEGHPLLLLEEAELGEAHAQAAEVVDPDALRPDLEEVLGRHELGRDARRPDAVARRVRTGQRTARANVDDLVDPGSFVEYGPLVIAAQRRRRSVEELIERTPADGLVAGIGRVNGDRFGEERSRCAVLAYDYTVLAGTQGLQNHRKKDRLFELAERWRLPVVFFTEGGGGRPGDTDGVGVAGLDCLAFWYFARLSGWVPLVGILSGRCFAGNAALLGCCDVAIATRGSNVGMGGPAMIEGGGLGIYRPEEVGPMEVQAPNGVVDVVVEDEAEAVRVAKQYLAYFQGALPDFACADQRRLRSLIPENRLRVYDVRRVIETLADRDSVLELRRAFAPGMVTALVRIEGRPVGVVANNPMHLSGAIDAPGADKAARFMQLCDAFDLPLLFLCDTPGIMVGPEVERTALVRHASRMFVVGASLSVPFFTIILRKGYGLGAQAMAGGSFKAPVFTVAWPTGEFGGMGLEGAVKLGFRGELAAIRDPEERRATFEQMVERMVQHGKALNTASHFEIDDVIDPADSRRWIGAALRAAPPPAPRSAKKRSCVDTW
jgi:acetyl/propionyl-CoA carboxylase alpha subunit/acetyl-CoA carboxylase carboxyltransferase component